ncbi:MAG: hypothetical protein ACFFCW_24315 [Candidatus Hodarchaeota archaeon]
MSIELPEANILAAQMNKKLRRKRIKSYHLQDFERLHRIDMLNRNTRSFDQLVNGKIEIGINGRNAIRIKLNNEMSLILRRSYAQRVERL